MILGTRFHEFAERFIIHNDMLPEDDWTSCIPSQFTNNEKENAAWFLENEYKKYKKYGRELWYPLCVEKKIKSATQYLSGIIDRVDMNPDKKSVTIVEYKTGKKNKPMSIKLQSALYKKLWDEIVPSLPATMCRVINPVIHIDEPYEIKKRHLTSIDEQIDALRDAIEMNIFPRNCNMMVYSYCGLCDIEEVDLNDY